MEGKPLRPVDHTLSDLWQKRVSELTDEEVEALKEKLLLASEEDLEPNETDFEHPDFPFNLLSKCARELYLTTEIARIPPPTALQFYREYVANNKPVIVTGVTDNWPASYLWTNTHLRKSMGDLEVTVAVTPSGRGDAVVDGMFVLPQEKKMKFSDFMDIMEGLSGEEEEKEEFTHGVHYLQKQNGCLPEEFAPLFEDVEDEISWAKEAFGQPPDAVNFWMGDDRAVSSTHQDPYENLYAVIKGSKHFTLFPPTDLYWLHRKKFRKAQYVQRDKKFEIVTCQPEESVDWIPVNPDNPDYEKHPKFAHASPVRCTVHPGEVLYLPAMWFHEVRQQGDHHGVHGRTIAVNWWYDMSYNVTYNYHTVMEAIVQKETRMKSKG